MTSGSCWTHLIVTGSGALVDEVQERVALARVTGQPALPAILTAIASSIAVLASSSASPSTMDGNAAATPRAG